VTRTKKTAQAESAKALLAALDRLPVAFALFDAGRRLAAWNEPLALLGLFPKSLLKQETPLAAFQRRDAGMKRKATSPHDIKLPDGKVLQATRRRVPPGQLLLTYEDVTEARRARGEATEALGQQAAAAEILKVISGSPADTQPVFEAIVNNAHRLIGAVFSILYRFDGKMLSVLADSQSNPKASAVLRGMYPAPARRGHIVGRAVLSGREMHTVDIRVDARFPANRNVHAKVSGFRAALVVPLLRDGAVIGAVAADRLDPRAFSRNEIRLLRTFADQAVIAIENVRLFNETKEALERQTATAEILKVISSSPTDLKPVFDAILENALRLCDAHLGILNLNEAGYFRAVAQRGADPESAKWFFERGAFKPENTLQRMIAERQPVQIPDMRETPAYRAGKPITVGLVEMAKARTLLVVPLLVKGEVIGNFAIYRPEVRLFSEKQIALVSTFADQAVIAIENVRLFNETKESLERQTATAEILKVIASSPSDVQPVFDAIAGSAARLFAPSDATIHIIEGDQILLGAHMGPHGSVRGSEMVKKFYPLPADPERGSLAQLIAARRIGEVRDSEAPGVNPRVTELGRTVGFRSILTVPLVRDGQSIGAISLSDPEPKPGWSERQRALLQTFADQAVIAIENVRLFNETREALEQQTASSEILGVISSSPTDLAPVFDAILDGATRLCDAHLGVLNLYDGENFRTVAQRGGNPEFAKWVFERGAIKPAGTMARMLAERRPCQLADLKDSAGFREGIANVVKFTELSGGRSFLIVPLLKEGRVIGGISIYRPEVRPFTEKQIELVKTFANQAVIAIENVRLFNETKEALERQTATAEILKVIASSPTDVQPVFDAIAASAMRLLGGRSALVSQVVGDMIHLSAHTATDQAAIDALRKNYPRPLSSAKAQARVMRSGKPEYRSDYENNPDASPEGKEMARAGGYRSILWVPLLRDGVAFGTINVTRPEAGPFADHQIKLLETFADQAVIAIENVRLFNETKEALEQQTATAEILKVISGSPTDTQPIFDAIVQSAVRLCNAVYSVGLRLEGGLIHLVAQHNLVGEGLAVVQRLFPMPVDRVHLTANSIRESRIIHQQNMQSDPEVPATSRELAIAAGYQTLLIVPMLREDRAIGAITVAKAEGPFSEKEMALLTTFAAQAVIAIENVRLFNETKESLERQTATAEILRVISSSPTDVQPVFDAIVTSARQLIGGYSAVVARVIDDSLHLAAFTATDKMSVEALKRFYPVPISGPYISKAFRTRAPIYMSDTEIDPETSPELRELARTRGYRSLLTVPMIREGVVIGMINVTRREPGPFTDHQINLVKTFADQAVIAIENVRLFKELQSRTEALSKSVGQLTALGEVGQAISASLELETVLKTIVVRAVQLTGLDAGVIYEYDESSEEFQLRASENFDEDSVASLRGAAIRRGEGAVGRSVETRAPTQVPDTHASDYPARLRELLDRQGFRAILAVPLLREDHIIGALMVIRKTAGAFAPETVDLLKTFATQSALAIQNARLFREIAEKGRQLEEASQHKSQFLASMSHELRTPLNAILGFNEMILDEVYGELSPDVKAPLENIQASGKHLLRLINNVLDLAKIEAGRMELALADYAVQDAVAGVRQTLQPLAAEKGLELLATVPADIPLAYGDGGRIAQCLMNLAGNSLKFTKQGRVEISVEQRDGLLRYSVADTGIGIPPEKIASLFTEFKQTDATIASEYGGTGLGLSISKKFVEMHGGRIWVESEPGRGSTFLFEIPLRAGER